MKQFLALTIGLSALTAGASSSLNVTAFPLWTDSGLTISAGATVSVSASGTWGFGLGGTGPGGTTWAETWDRFTASGQQGELIAYIGADPFQGHWGDSNFFPQATGYIVVGPGASFSAGHSGELWLGINDDAVSKATSDNSGSLTAQISVVPEPNVGYLLMGALATMGLLKRRQPLAGSGTYLHSKTSHFMLSRTFLRCGFRSGQNHTVRAWDSSGRD
jgi:hypothetical protein